MIKLYSRNNCGLVWAGRQPGSQAARHMNEMLGRVGVNAGGLVGRKVRTHVSWLGQYFQIY